MEVTQDSRIVGKNDFTIYVIETAKQLEVSDVCTPRCADITVGSIMFFNIAAFKNTRKIRLEFFIAPYHFYDYTRIVVM